MAIESPIVFGGIKSHGCSIGGRGVLGVMLDFYPIYMKFGMEVEFVELNDFPKFGSDQLITRPVIARTKKFSSPFTLVCAITVDVIAT